MFWSLSRFAEFEQSFTVIEINLQVIQERNHETLFNAKTFVGSPRLYSSRVACGDRDHRDLGRIAIAGSASGSGGGASHVVLEQHPADRARIPKLS
jgi:hypothetical protein